MWISAKCPACRYVVAFNGRKQGHLTCRAQIIHHWAGRRLDVVAPAYQWQADPEGDAEVRYRDLDGHLVTQRGTWRSLPTGTLERPDGRRGYYPSLGW